MHYPNLRLHPKATQGQALPEYGLVIAFMSILMITTLTLWGQGMGESLKQVGALIVSLSGG
jgi:Flp pilus assembly pilin Flp